MAAAVFGSAAVIAAAALLAQAAAPSFGPDQGRALTAEAAERAPTLIRRLVRAF